MTDLLRILTIFEILISVGFFTGIMINANRLTTVPVLMWGIGLSWIMYSAAALEVIYYRYSTDKALDWHTPLFFVSATIAMSAMVYYYTKWTASGKAARNE